ncbi:MAG TPA: S8 family serine peptidase [Candidatus Cryosericum sp.]|nr:S8 family serine peptidase [Candidatus Cryosericum sp.]
MRTKQRGSALGGTLTTMARIAARATLASIVLLAAAVTSPCLHADPQGKVSDAVLEKVRGSQPGDLLPVIVQTQGDPSDSHLGRLQGRGGKLKTRHQSVTGYSAVVPAASLAALSEDPEVERISYDAPVRALLDVALKAVRADLAPAGPGGLDGTGIGIALIDTGVQAHVDLVSGRGPTDVVEVEIVGREKGLEDHFGHGTHVAGVLTGSGAASSGPQAFRTFRGVAPGARLISVRALQSDGTGTTSDVLAGIDWVLTHRKGYNIRVLNLSLGHAIEESFVTDPLCRAVRRAVQSGIVVVTAAGNGGRIGTGFGTILSPANEPSVITVGAMDDSNTVAREDDVLAPYSAKGPTLIDSILKPDLVAPGSSIVSLRAVGSLIDTTHPELVMKTGDYSAAQPRDAVGAYLTLSGTSLAAPLVSGAAALMLQQEPLLTPADVKARLMLTASKDDYLPFETGAGYLDVQAALASTDHTLSALSPRALAGPGGEITLLPFEQAWDGAWQQSLIWGGRYLGRVLMTENDRVTGSGLVWSGGNRALGLDPTLDPLGIIWSGGNKQGNGSALGALGIIWSGGNNKAGDAAGVGTLGIIWSGGNKTLGEDANVETLGIIWSGGI